MEKVNRFSYSQINKWDQCPRAYEYQYIKKIPMAQGGRLIAGNAYHRGTAYALGSKANGFEVTNEEIQDIISNAWDGLLADKIIKGEGGETILERKNIDWKDDEPGKLKDKVIELALLYVKEQLPILNPIVVEKRHTRELIPGVTFVGYPDVEFLDQSIADHKFVTRRASQNKVDNDMQANAYGFLLGRAVEYFLHQALDQKKPGIDIISTKRSLEDIEWYIKKAIMTWKLIQTGLFPPNTTSWYCSEDYCAYYYECRIFREA